MAVAKTERGKYSLRETVAGVDGSNVLQMQPA